LAVTAALKSSRDRALLAGDPLRLLDQAPRHRDRRDLAAGHLLALGDSLTVHERENGNRAERVDGVDEIATHAQQPAVAGDQARLALHWRL
jgi:hypothetical protein